MKGGVKIPLGRLFSISLESCISCIPVSTRKQRVTLPTVLEQQNTISW